ncbi:MAG TPA: aconitase X catalytic domain-containing protein [Actinomycetota bacterium]
MLDTLNLDERDLALLEGEGGEAARLAMRLVVLMARVAEAPRLIDVTRAHIDGCLYHGPVSLEFAERLVAGGGQASVPTTLNVGSLDLLHPKLYRGEPETAAAARRLMDAYVEMGCRPTWTCAPYQEAEARPSRGEHVAWAESNAIVFANSVLGARTERYGDFIDICAAITGRVPDAGLHRDEHRRGEVVFDLAQVPERLLCEDALYPALGHLVGRQTGTAVPVLSGLPPDASEDRLKALGAAAASSGSVALFHAVGITPEAPTLEAALHGRPPRREVSVTGPGLREARDSLSTSPGGRIGAVSVGTPHASLEELEKLAKELDGAGGPPAVPLYVSTSREILAEAERRGSIGPIEAAGAIVVTDTCTYVTPIIGEVRGPVMTNSAKWAYYAPGNLGIEVVFGSLTECVRSAVAGEARRDDALWADD